MNKRDNQLQEELERLVKETACLDLVITLLNTFELHLTASGKRLLRLARQTWEADNA